MPEDTRGCVGEPRNVLYLTDQHDECDEAGCMDLLGADAPEAVDVLFVSFTETARERLATWRRHADAPPANVGVVSVETGGSGSEAAVGDGGPTVRRVSDPSDLTGVGIAISEFLGEWVGNGNRTVVCFDSLTALLQYLDPRRVFQFCNEITSKFETAGAAAHFHITPGAHDRQVLSVLASLFDDRVSAADLGHGRRGYGGSEDPPAGPSESVDPSAPSDSRAPTAADGDPATPDDPETAEAPDEGGFVFAGDEFSREATAEPDVDDSSPPADAPGEPGPSGSDEQVRAGGSDDTDSPSEAEGTDSPSEAEGTDPPSGTAGTGSPAEASETDAEAERNGTDDPGPDQEPSGEPGGSALGPGPVDEDPAGSTGDGVIPRTTATVVGVVVMLLLMSFFAAAFPAPMVLDDAGDAVGADTATPEDAASGADATASTPTAMSSATATSTATSTATATETAASSETPAETESADNTPAPDETTASSSPSTDPGFSTPASTTEPTPTATAPEVATPTPTPEDGGILDDPFEGL